MLVVATMFPTLSLRNSSSAAALCPNLRTNSESSLNIARVGHVSFASLPPEWPVASGNLLRPHLAARMPLNTSIRRADFAPRQWVLH